MNLNKFNKLTKFKMTNTQTKKTIGGTQVSMPSMPVITIPNLNLSGFPVVRGQLNS